ncbi:hypothetical protein [Streptomyces sp. NPDC058678]|uniref:hypothetical protein n=1 Tax=Streptomyces sp. NPDC058678 TaxID=3346595 RepID=UPI003668E316
MPSPSQPSTGERRPRAMVIDGAWRGLGPGPQALSGPGGAPLTRTVKLIVLPLIVRPALRPEFAADFLDAREAEQLDALIRESGAVLEGTARWFTLLKKTRRALGIVAGNPQDLYFQRCLRRGLTRRPSTPWSGHVAPVQPYPKAPHVSGPWGAQVLGEGVQHTAVRVGAGEDGHPAGSEDRSLPLPAAVDDAVCRRRSRHGGPGTQRIEAHRESAAEHDGDAQALVVQAERGAAAVDLPPDELRHGRQLLAVGRRLEHGEEPFEE